MKRKIKISLDLFRVKWNMDTDRVAQLKEAMSKMSEEERKEFMAQMDKDLENYMET